MAIKRKSPALFLAALPILMLTLSFPSTGVESVPFWFHSTNWNGGVVWTTVPVGCRMPLHFLQKSILFHHSFNPFLKRCAIDKITV